MKTTHFLIVSLLFVSLTLNSQTNDVPDIGHWQIGIGLGELPLSGSFKPSISFGYHFNDKLYAGVMYQFKDKINRDNSSFNVKSTDLNGLVSSNEKVSQRFLIQLRYTPFKKGPYLSAGYVYNDTDTERMVFDSRTRTINGNTYDGTIIIDQTRPKGCGIALGLGYQYDFKNGISINTEWTPAWFKGYAQPKYTFSGDANLSASSQSYIKEKMDDGFKSSVTNLYKVFHIGVAYKFK